MLSAEFHMLVLLYRTINDHGTTYTFDDTTFQALQKEAEIGLPNLVDQLAGSQIELRTHVEVMNGVVNARPDGLADDASTASDIDALVHSGWYDHVTILHPNGRGPFNGACCLEGGVNGIAGLRSSTIAIDFDKGVVDDAPGILHEWMHALERFYFENHGVAWGNDPLGGPLGIHSGEEFGYTESLDDRPGWVAWYRDFLTDHIHNYHGDGSDSGRGLGPDAWAIGTPRSFVATIPGSPFSFPEISKQSLTYLSEVHWAADSTEWGEIRRDRTVYDNPIVVNGVSYLKGVGIHANGEIRVNLRGRAERFQAEIGIPDDIVPPNGSVVFQVFADGGLLYESPVMTSADDAIPIDVDVFGRQQLTLLVNDGGDGINSDHGVWADAKFTPFSGVFISDIEWSASSTGNGRVQLDRSILGNPLTVNQVHYGKGVGIHAPGVIGIPTGSHYRSFQANVGIHDEVFGTVGASQFHVVRDDQAPVTSSVVTSNSSAFLMTSDISNVDTLSLFVSDADDFNESGNLFDHAVWGNAFLMPNAAFDVIVDDHVQISEGDGWHQFDVVLSNKPAANVTIDVFSDRTEELSVANARVQFTPDNWFVPQTVFFSAVDDQAADGQHDANIVLRVNDSLSDDEFDSIEDQAIAVSVLDNDIAQVQVLGGWNTTTGDWYFGENNGTGINQLDGPLWSPSNGWDIHFGDFTGDGISDVAGRTDGGAWYVIDGETRMSSYWGSWGSDSTQHWNDAAFQGFVGVGDVNGDGFADIIGKNWVGGLFVAISDGMSFSGASYFGRVAQSGWVAHKLGDFNGDGRTDVVSFHENGARWVSESNGTQFSLDYHGRVSDQATAGWQNFLVGDFNGDGLDDIIQQLSSGQWWKGSSDGLANGAFVTSYANRWDPTAFNDFHVGDFNGDGKDDLLGRTSTNQIWVNRSLANGRMNAEYWNRWAAGSDFTTTVGDFNGDGKDDLVGVRQADGYWFIQRSLGNRFTGNLFGTWTNFTGSNLISTP